MNDKERKAKKARDAAHKRESRTLAVRQGLRVPLTVIGLKTRECGECQACCVALAVDVHGKDKPAGQKCQHQCEKGCGIYADRPEACSGYWCLYLSGFLVGGEDMRPDRLGVVLDARGPHGKNIILFSEVWPGAISQPKVRELARRIQQSGQFRVYFAPFGSSDGKALFPGWVIFAQEKLS